MVQSLKFVGKIILFAIGILMLALIVSLVTQLLCFLVQSAFGIIGVAVFGIAFLLGAATFFAYITK